MRYEESYAPRIGDYDGEGRMFLSAVLRILEDIASRHSAYVGDCVIEDTRRGVACRYAQVGGVHTVGVYGGDGTLRALVELE